MRARFSISECRSRASRDGATCVGCFDPSAVALEPLWHLECGPRLDDSGHTAAPVIIGQELFPERQTGVEVLGQFDVSAHNTFGYPATISNGLGPISEYRDLDGNKAFGGRAYWSYNGFGELRVGASAFYGTDTSAREVPGLASDGQHLKYNQQITTKAFLTPKVKVLSVDDKTAGEHGYPLQP